jgi:hypothetical protein
VGAKGLWTMCSSRLSSSTVCRLHSAVPSLLSCVPVTSVLRGLGVPLVGTKACQGTRCADVGAAGAALRDGWAGVERVRRVCGRCAVSSTLHGGGRLCCCCLLVCAAPAHAAWERHERMNQSATISEATCYLTTSLRCVIKSGM